MYIYIYIYTHSVATFRGEGGPSPRVAARLDPNMPFGSSTPMYLDMGFETLNLFFLRTEIVRTDRVEGARRF